MAVIETSTKSSPLNLSEVEKNIVSVLDDEIRPAIAQDGGDVIYHGFEDGIVLLELIGARSYKFKQNNTVFKTVVNYISSILSDCRPNFII